jgi:hypothetical protein
MLLETIQSSGMALALFNIEHEMMYDMKNYLNESFLEKLAVLLR